MKDNLTNSILEILSTSEYVKTEDLCNALFASPSTVRRRLAKMEQDGLIKRTHGGAVINEAIQGLPSFNTRTHMNTYEKKKIALKALKLINDGDVIFIDGSSSTFFIAQYFNEFKNIKVITNSIDTLYLLAKQGVEVYSTGGFVLNKDNSVLAGSYAERMVESIKADILFFSVASITQNADLYCLDNQEFSLIWKMMKNSKKKVLVCDKTKFNDNASFKLCEKTDFDYLITDFDTENYFTTDVDFKIIF